VSEFERTWDRWTLHPAACAARASLSSAAWVALGVWFAARETSTAWLVAWVVVGTLHACIGCYAGASAWRMAKMRRRFDDDG
jgi:hypothetical protein